MARIWIPDDSNLLLSVIGRSLRRAGHTVVSCSSPEFALVRPGQLRKGENVLVVDLTTDENREMAVMLKVRIPRLKALFVAGPATPTAGSGDSGLAQAFAPADRRYLHKPFTGNELLTKIDSLLAGEMDKAVRAAAGAA